MTGQAKFSSFKTFEGAATRVFELTEALREIESLADTWPIRSVHQASGIAGRIRGIARKALGDERTGPVAAVMFGGQRYYGRLVNNQPDPESPNFIEIELVTGSKARMSVIGPRVEDRPQDLEPPIKAL